MADFKMPDINKVFFAGRLTRDPELKYISSGKAVCKLGIAISRNYKTRDGEKREDTTFIDVTVWDRLAEFCGENLRKGRPVYVEGSLRSDAWEDKQTGQKRTKIEVRGLSVQTLDWEDRGGGGGGGGSNYRSRNSGGDNDGGGSRGGGGGGNYDDAPEDDIPF